MSLELKLRVAPQSAAIARRFIRDHAVLDSMRHAEAGLLITELIGNVVRHSPAKEMMLGIDTADRRGLRITLSHPSRGPLEAPQPGMGFTLLDRISQRWEFQHDGERLSFSFVVRTPGVAIIPEELPDEALFEHMDEDPAAYSDELIRRHHGLAEGIARRYRGKGIDDEDLLQVARMALLKAIQGYDPDLGDIRPYAAATINGEMKKLLRDRGWSVRVPRPLQERALAVTKAARELGQRFGREPEIKELAEHLGVSQGEVVEARDARQAYDSKSLDKTTDRTGVTLADRLEIEDWSLLGADDRVVLEQAISRLPERSRRILALRFNEDMTQTQIAEEIGISQMHVSRLLTGAIDELRRLLDTESRAELNRRLT